MTYFPPVRQLVCTVKPHLFPPAYFPHANNHLHSNKVRCPPKSSMYMCQFSTQLHKLVPFE